MIGLGGVLCRDRGRAAAGATTIIGLDVDEKLAAAEKLGATHTLCTKDLSPQQVAEKVQEPSPAASARTSSSTRVGILQQTYETVAFYARTSPTRGPRRRSPPGCRDHAPHARRVRSRRCAEVLLVRRLPPRAGLPRLTDLFLQAVCRWTASSPAAPISPARTRRWTAPGTTARTCAPWWRWPSDRAAGPCRHLAGDVLPGRRDPRGRQQRVGARRRRAVRGLRRPARRREGRGASSETASVGILLTHAHDDHTCASPRASPRGASRPRSC